MKHEAQTTVPKRVARELSVLIEWRGKPGMIVSDNGTEFTSNAVLSFHHAGQADAKRLL